jgi:hypothetical protein
VSNNVIGPISQSDWNTMSYLLQSVKWDKKQQGEKWRELEAQETELYEGYKRKVFASCAA